MFFLEIYEYLFYNLLSGDNVSKRIIMHVDVNNAFLSWTAVKLLKEGSKVDIREIPSVIGGDEEQRHGVVLAKSMVAKSMGIVTGESLYSARKKCPSLISYLPCFDYYQVQSSLLYDYLSSYTPDIERFSIDECFLDMSNFSYIYSDIVSLAYKIKDDIKEKFGFTVNIGIGNNKLCAKMASDFEKPDKVHTLFEDEIESKMWNKDVADLFMVGKSSSDKLKSLGINTIGMLANSDINFLTKYFKSHGKLMWEYANGIDDSKLNDTFVKNKAFSMTRTLPYDTRNVQKLRKHLLIQADNVCYQARREKLFTKTVTLIIRTSDFVNFSRQEVLNEQTNDTEVVYKMASLILDKVLESNQVMKIRNIGLRISGLKAKEEKQLSFFDSKVDSSNNDIQDAIDRINEKFGTNSVIKASLVEK